MNKIGKWLLKENLHDVRYMTQVIRYIRNERMTSDSVAAFLDEWVPEHGLMDTTKAEIVAWKMIEGTLKNREADLTELFDSACIYADTFLQDYPFIHAAVEEQPKMHNIVQGSKKERAKHLFVLKYNKADRDNVRKILLQDFQNLGMTKQGAVTYFHKFEKGEW